MLTRRAWLTRCLAVAGGLLLARTRGAVAAGHAGPILQPPQPTHAAFIGRAFDLRDAATAAGDQPYGAVVVQGGKIISEMPSRVITGADPTAHAEMEAIRDAVRRVGPAGVRGAVLYSSSQPCPMCQSAAFWAGISRMRYGRDATDGGPPTLPYC